VAHPALRQILGQFKFDPFMQWLVYVPFYALLVAAMVLTPDNARELEATISWKPCCWLRASAPSESGDKNNFAMSTRRGTSICAFADPFNGSSFPTIGRTCHFRARRQSLRKFH